ncbi:TonB-dependent siderophore receptor [Modicisalibacter luteus]|uniref:TonB-dependent siderophore receptor n=1 Tax=Modicisalibacter luteus TaxID=453962 RepID=UPI001E526C31|nr:TonB-dependent siderophore receptor [Halomonas lutea]
MSDAYKRTPLSLAIGGTLLLGVSPSGWAQDAASGIADDRLATITVEGNRLYEMLPSEETEGYDVDAATVGTKIPAALRDIPQSITVVTRDAIEDRNLDTLDELGQRTPGMRVLNNDDGRSSIYARGYEYDEYNIDGLPAPMQSINGTVPTLSAFDRVEVMRGPSGLFNSTSEMGGIVNLVRKRPTDEFQGHVIGRYGSWDQRYLESDIAGPIDSEGRMRGRLVVSDSATEGFVDHNDNENQTFYGALDIDLDEATTLSLAFLRQVKDITVNNGQATDTNGDLLYSDRSTFFGADWNAFTMQSNDSLVELTHRFANGGYGRFAARYSDRKADYNYAFGGGSVSDDGVVSIAGTAGDIEQQALSMDASYSQPFAALGSVSEFVVGSDYKRYETDTLAAKARLGTSTVDTFADIAYVDILADYLSTDTRETLEETGLYSKLTFRPVAPLALTVGGRISDYEVELENQLTDTDYVRDDNEFTSYAGAVYDLDPNHSLYTSYSEVFKPQTEYDANGDLLEPREGTQYEVGIKGSYLDGDLNARLSAFRLYDENTAAGVTGETYSAAIGERRIQGAELEVVGSPLPGWDVIAGYTYMETDVDNAETPATFLLMPRNLFNLWTQYGFEGGTLEGWHVGGGVTAMSDFSSSQGIKAPGYAVFDAMLGYDFTSQLSGQVNLNNVFDRDYYTRVGSTGTFNMVGEPANVVASLRYDF